MGRWRAALGIAIAIATSPLAAQDRAALDPDDPPAVIRTIPSGDTRITIPIQIDGRGPWNFVVDTGSQRTVISRALAERLDTLGRASWRERVGQYVYISVVAAALKKKKKKIRNERET